MILKKSTALAGLVLCLVPMTVTVASTKTMHTMAAKPMAAATMYQCSKCHMKFTAAQAKKDHYKDPMDGGKLLPVKAAKAAKPMAGMKM